MKRIVKKLMIIFIMMLFGVVAILPESANASTGLVVMTKSDGTDLTYRNSSEKVYQLAEYNYPTNQLRAVWVSAFVGDVSAYTSESAWKSELNGLLDNMEDMGMNAIVFHVRTHNNALYKSELNPLATWFSNVNFDEFDPLAWLIDECHNRGIEFHAWLNPYRVSANGDVTQFKAEAMGENNPASKAENLLTVDQSIILDPGIPENRQFIIDTCMELIENYDVDAINFDDYFYTKNADDTTTREKYNTSNLSVGDFRRLQVNLFIEELSKQIRTYNEENDKMVQLGIAPSGIYRNGSYKSSPTYDSNGNLTSPLYSNTSGMEHYDNYLYADTLNWINNEWIDYIMPQLYWATEHTNASFVELTKWWSWAVRNKNVNFYAGIGIYMADNPTSTSGSYWQLNENEVERQLLNAGQYAEFGGACFYKYSYMFSSNTIIQNGVNLISNDYWAKRVPGAIVKSYADKIDEVTPTNVGYSSATTSITFDEVANARGYMVYQVPKGNLLDTTNINHVYVYTQDTSVLITDTLNYDYYVASVNKANEISETVYVNVNLSAENVSALIDNLPSDITIEHKGEVEQIRNLYNWLSDEEKALVTNIDKLVSAEQKISDIETVGVLIDEYIATVDTHIITNRRLPQFENAQWSYKDEADAALYNLTTGEKYKSPLATTLITLIFTLTQGEVTASKEVEINIGYTAVDQTALFYRNDPSAMNDDDEGAYGASSEKFIGWSGHTVVIEDEILFIALDNYYEITDATAITACKWVSAAGVYVNKTGDTINFNLSSAFGNTSSKYDGYIIISKVGQIKTLVHGYDTSVDVVLEDDEAIVIIRYLDGYMDGSPWAPVTNLSIGLTAYIDNPPSYSYEDEAASFDERVNLLPEEITLSDEVEVNELLKIYNGYDEETKVLITTYDKLMAAYNTVEKLKSELATLKASSIYSIENYVDFADYSFSNQSLINDYIDLAIVGIESAKTVGDVNYVTEQTKLKIDAIPLLVDELATLRSSYVEKINQYVDSLNYSENEMALVNQNKENVIKSINESTLDIEMQQLYDDFKVNTESYHSSLVTAVNSVNAKLDQLVELGNTEAQKAQILIYINTAKENILTYITVLEVNTEYDKTEELVMKYVEEISNSIANAISEINKTTNTTQEVIDLVVEYKCIIENSQTNEQVDVYLFEFNSKLNLILKEYAIVQARKTTINNINAYYNSLSYNEKLKLYVLENKEILIEEINESIDLEYIDSADKNFIETMTYYCEYVIAKINTAVKYIDGKSSSKEKVVQLKQDTITKLKEAGSVEEVNNILEQFNEEYSKINSVVISCKNNSIVWILYSTFFMIVTIGYIKLKQK